MAAQLSWVRRLMTNESREQLNSPGQRHASPLKPPTRPLWYRAASWLEPFRPAFAWLVQHEKSAGSTVGMLLLLALAGSAVGAIRLVRRNGV